MSAASLSPVSPFAGLPIHGGPGRSIHGAPGSGVIATDLSGQLGITTVVGSRGRLEELLTRVRTTLGVDLPQTPRRVSSGSIDFIGDGPEKWLALGRHSPAAFLQIIEHAAGELALVSDQGSALAALRVTGPRIRCALAKLLPIDLHPRVFRVGDAAVTGAHHIAIRLWRLEDGPDGSAIFELLVARSLAVSFWAGLTESAAEFGFVLGSG